MFTVFLLMTQCDLAEMFLIQRELAHSVSEDDISSAALVPPTTKNANI